MPLAAAPARCYPDTMLLHLDHGDRTLTVSLRWPDARCLLDAATAGDLATTLAGLPDACRAVVLRSDGPAFCLGEIDEPADVAGRSPGALAAEALAAVRQPVICMIAGAVEDAGLELALAADLRIASAAATFRMGHLQRGALPACGGTQRLPRIVGRAAALELLLLGASIDAARALEIGLVHRAVPADAVTGVVAAVVERLGRAAPIAVEYVKEAVLRGVERPLTEGLHLEADLYALLQTTADRTEGIRAFLEHRSPRFEGR